MSLHYMCIENLPQFCKMSGLATNMMHSQNYCQHCG